MNIKLISAKGGKDFVGIKYTENDIQVYYPETFRWKFPLPSELSVINIEEDISQGIRTIISNIEYAKTHSKETTAQNDNCDNEESFAMKSYLWLMKDFMNNGSYKNRENVFKVNQKGKIDWKRTLSQIPLFSDGNFIYKDLIVTTKSQTDNLLVEIYRFCVRKSIYLVGWLYNIRSSTLGVKSMEDIELQVATKKKYVYTIKCELSRTFDDEKRLRLTHMLNVVQGLNKSNNGQLVYGVDNFDYVFERTVDKVLGTENVKDTCSPHGEWCIGKVSVPLRPDSILKKENTYIIIDSKCYRYSEEGYGKDCTEGLPATDSIQKQVTYGDQLRKDLIAEGISNTIYNCFIIPYNKQKDYGNKLKTNEMFQYSGVYASASWRDNTNEYEKIYVILADMRDLLEKAREYDHTAEQERLIDILKQVI